MDEKGNEYNRWVDALIQSEKLIGKDITFISKDELAKEILRENARRELSKSYNAYLFTEHWKVVKSKVLERDNYLCQDCLRYNRVEYAKDIFRRIGLDFDNFHINIKATCVHHTSYHNIMKDEEIDDCISLCDECHILRHELQDISNFQILSRQIRKKIARDVYKHILKDIDWREILNAYHNKDIEDITVPYKKWRG